MRAWVVGFRRSRARSRKSTRLQSGGIRGRRCGDHFLARRACRRNTVGHSGGGDGWLVGEEKMVVVCEDQGLNSEEGTEPC